MDSNPPRLASHQGKIMVVASPRLGIREVMVFAAIAMVVLMVVLLPTKFLVWFVKE